MTENTSLAPTSSQARPIALIASAAVFWAAAVVWASPSGLLETLGRHFMPGFALLVALGIAIPVTLYFALPAVTRAVDAIGLHRLTMVHIWRIPAALVFLWYGFRDELPPLFWIIAGGGDFLAGAYAATLLWRERTLALYHRMHVFGSVDFALAVGLGLTFTLLDDPRMTLLTSLPFALIPLFGVGPSGASHIVVLTRLSRHHAQ